MRFKLGLAAVVAVSVVLVGCGKYHGQYGGRYYQQDAQVMHPIVVPKGVPSPVSDQIFTVPRQDLAEGNTHPSLLPPDPTFLAYNAQYNHKNQSTKKK